jgi:hypothetical protein
MRYFAYVANPVNPIYFAYDTDGTVQGYFWKDGEWVAEDNKRANLVGMVFFGEPYLDEIPESALPAGIDPL